MANVQTVTLLVPDISCGHCVNTIQRTVGILPGVESVVADATLKTATVRYDQEQQTQEVIEGALAEAGYPVSKEAVKRPRTTGKRLNLF